MMFYATAMLIGNGVGENTLRKTRVENSESALFVSTEAMTNRLIIAPAYHGTGQTVRV